jgi:hypothetical protein
MQNFIILTLANLLWQLKLFLRYRFLKDSSDDQDTLSKLSKHNNTEGNLRYRNIKKNENEEKLFLFSLKLGKKYRIAKGS